MLAMKDNVMIAVPRCFDQIRDQISRNLFRNKTTSNLKNRV